MAPLLANIRSSPSCSSISKEDNQSRSTLYSYVQSSLSESKIAVNDDTGAEQGLPAVALPLDPVSSAETSKQPNLPSAPNNGPESSNDKDCGHSPGSFSIHIQQPAVGHEPVGDGIAAPNKGTGDPVAQTSIRSISSSRFIETPSGFTEDLTNLEAKDQIVRLRMESADLVDGTEYDEKKNDGTDRSSRGGETKLASDNRKTCVDEQCLNETDKPVDNHADQEHCHDAKDFQGNGRDINAVEVRDDGANGDEEKNEDAEANQGKESSNAEDKGQNEGDNVKNEEASSNSEEVFRHIAKVNRMKLNDFRNPHLKSDYAIDVYIGDPTLTDGNPVTLDKGTHTAPAPAPASASGADDFLAPKATATVQVLKKEGTQQVRKDTASYHRGKKETSNLEGERKDAAAAKDDSTKAGIELGGSSFKSNKPVVERIRINSEHITEALNTLATKDFNTEESYLSAPCTLVAPFTILFHFHERLYERLRVYLEEYQNLHAALVSHTSEPSHEKSQESVHSVSQPEAEDLSNKEGNSEPGSRVKGGKSESPVAEASTKAAKNTVESTDLTEITKVEDSTEAAEKSRETDANDSAERIEVATQPVPKDPKFLNAKERITHLRLLLDFMDTDLKDTIALRKEIAAGTLRKIAFRDLWHLYQPGELVLSSVNNKEQALRVHETAGGRKSLADDTLNQCAAYAGQKFSPFWLLCGSFNFDGEEYGPVSQLFSIQPYKGEKEVTSLLVHPAKSAGDLNDIKEKFLRRGRCFRQMCSVVHMEHSGNALAEPIPVRTCLFCLSRIR